MPTNIVCLTGRYHFGDMPGLFQDALCIGHDLNLPMRKTWINPQANNLTLFFYTHDVETWGSWQGHKVSINGQEIGRLKDPADIQGKVETFSIPIARARLEQLLGGSDNFLLSISLEHQPATPGMADDFVFLRLETDDNFAVVFGWK